MRASVANLCPTLSRAYLQISINAITQWSVMMTHIKSFIILPFITKSVALAHAERSGTKRSHLGSNSSNYSVVNKFLKHPVIDALRIIVQKKHLYPQTDVVLFLQKWLSSCTAERSWCVPFHITSSILRYAKLLSTQILVHLLIHGNTRCTFSASTWRLKPPETEPITYWSSSTSKASDATSDSRSLRSLLVTTAFLHSSRTPFPVLTACHVWSPPTEIQAPYYARHPCSSLLLAFSPSSFPVTTSSSNSVPTHNDQLQSTSDQNESVSLYSVKRCTVNPAYVLHSPPTSFRTLLTASTRRFCFIRTVVFLFTHTNSIRPPAFLW